MEMVDVSCLMDRLNRKNDPLEGRQEDMTTERNVREKTNALDVLFTE